MIPTPSWNPGEDSSGGGGGGVGCGAGTPSMDTVTPIDLGPAGALCSRVMIAKDGCVAVDGTDASKSKTEKVTECTPPLLDAGCRVSGRLGVSSDSDTA